MLRYVTDLATPEPFLFQELLTGVFDLLDRHGRAAVARRLALPVVAAPVELPLTPPGVAENGLGLAPPIPALQLFRARTISRRRCLVCRASSENFEESLGFSLGIAGCKNVAQCLGGYTAVEQEVSSRGMALVRGCCVRIGTHACLACRALTPNAMAATARCNN